MTEKKLCVYEIEDVFKTYDLLTHGTGFYSYISDKIRELRQSGHEGTARAYIIRKTACSSFQNETFQF